MTVFVREQDVAAGLSMDATLRAVERSFHRLADGAIRQEPRVRVPFAAGYLAAMSAVDAGLGLGLVKSYVVVDGRLGGLLVTLSSLRDGSVEAVIEGDLLTAMRTGAGSGVAAAHLARPGARSIGVIGCGRQAPFQLDAIRRSLPGPTSAVAWTRRPEQLAGFCAATGAAPAASARDAAACDVVIAATTSPSPVIEGAWLRPGALVVLIGGDGHGDRELDDVGVERAAIVACDSIASSRVDAADLWAPIERHLLAWDDVVELQDVVVGAHPGRTDDGQIIVFKSNGLAAWDMAAAAELMARSGPR